MQMVYFGMSIQLSMTLFTAWMVRSNAISSWFPPPVTPPMVPPQGLPSGYLLPIFKPPAELYNPDTTVFAGTIVFEVCTNLFILLW